MNDRRFDEWLDNAVAGLPRERQPEDDLWPGIHDRIRRQSRPGPLFTVAAAASVAALAIAAWLFQQQPVNPALDAAGPTVARSALQSAADMEAEYREALLAAAGPGAAGLPAPERTLVEAELDGIEQAQRSIRRAMREQPDSAYLVSLLAQTHAQRIDLVQRLAARPTDEGELHENGNV